MVVGIVALLVALVPVLGALVGVAAVVLGALTLRGRERKGLGWLAIGLGALAALGSVLMTVVVAVAPSVPPVAVETGQVDEVTSAPIEEPEPTTEAPAAPTVDASQAPAEIPAETEAEDDMAERVADAVLMDGVYASFQGACADGIDWICQISEIKPGPNTGDVEVWASSGAASWEDITRGVANFSCAVDVKPNWIIVYDLQGRVQHQAKASSFPACNL